MCNIVPCSAAGSFLRSHRFAVALPLSDLFDSPDSPHFVAIPAPYHVSCASPLPVTLRGNADNVRSNPLFGGAQFGNYGDAESVSSYSSLNSGSLESLDLDNLSNFELPESEEEEYDFTMGGYSEKAPMFRNPPGLADFSDSEASAPSGYTSLSEGEIEEYERVISRPGSYLSVEDWKRTSRKPSDASASGYNRRSRVGSTLGLESYLAVNDAPAAPKSILKTPALLPETAEYVPDWKKTQRRPKKKKTVSFGDEPSSGSEGSGDEGAVVVRARFEDIDRDIHQKRPSTATVSKWTPPAPAGPAAATGTTLEAHARGEAPVMRQAAAKTNNPKAMDQMDGLGHFKAIRDLWSKR